MLGSAFYPCPYWVFSIGAHNDYGPESPCIVVMLPLAALGGIIDLYVQRIIHV